MAPSCATTLDEYVPDVEPSGNDRKKTDLPNRHSTGITTTVERGAHKLRMFVKNLVLAMCSSAN